MVLPLYVNAGPFSMERKSGVLFCLGVQELYFNYCFAQFANKSNVSPLSADGKCVV